MSGQSGRPRDAVSLDDVRDELAAAGHLEAMRAVLFNGDLPSAGDALYTAVAAVVALAAGAWVFSRSDDRIAVEV